MKPKGKKNMTVISYDVFQIVSDRYSSCNKTDLYKLNKMQRYYLYNKKVMCK